MAGIVNEQFVFFCQQVAKFVERVDDIGPRGVDQQSDLESVKFFQQLRDGLRIRHGGF